MVDIYPPFPPALRTIPPWCSSIPHFEAFCEIGGSVRLHVPTRLVFVLRVLCNTLPWVVHNPPGISLSFSIPGKRPSDAQVRTRIAEVWTVIVGSGLVRVIDAIPIEPVHVHGCLFAPCISGS